MSDVDVPGTHNHDQLAMGCWAEHDDGSLILVESTEASRVIYSVFDMAHDPPIEYRDAMPEASFKTTYSWRTGTSKEKWTWHDKTPFPWEKVIKHFKDGPKSAAADHITTAAERIRNSRERHRTDALPVERHSTAAERVAGELRLRGQELDRSDFEDRMERVLGRVAGMFERIVSAAERAGLKKGKGSGSAARR